MHPDFQIDYRHSAGNLHIQLTGTFSRMCAWALFKTIRHYYAGTGRIFVNTKHIDQVLSAGVDSFKNYMTHDRMLPDWLYFKGEKGFVIAPNGSRVITSPKDGRRRWHHRAGGTLLKACR